MNKKSTLFQTNKMERTTFFLIVYKHSSNYILQNIIKIIFFSGIFAVYQKIKENIHFERSSNLNISP